MFETIKTRTLLSTLWVVLMLNMIYVDVLAQNIPGIREEMLAFAGETPIPQLMFFAAIVIEIPILMVLLSRLLKWGISRWVNMGAAVLMIAFVVGPEIGNPAVNPHYLFMGAIEVLFMIGVIVVAWQWKEQEA